MTSSRLLKQWSSIWGARRKAPEAVFGPDEGIGLMFGEEKHECDEVRLESGSSRKQINSTTAFKCSIFVLAIVCLLQFTYIVCTSSLLHKGRFSYESGFETDFEDAKSSISIERRRFSNAIRADSNGTLYAVIEPGETRYSGTPSKEVDQAWDELAGRRYFRFKEDEVRRLDQDVLSLPLEPIPKRLQVEVPGFYGGVDMLHSLHCINSLRMHLDPEYYKEHITKLPMKYRRLHLDHCIDQLRQTVMCSGDLTPVTLTPVRAPQDHMFFYLGQTEREHTCRNAQAVREWASRRGEEMGATSFE